MFLAWLLGDIIMSSNFLKILCVCVCAVGKCTCFDSGISRTSSHSQPLGWAVVNVCQGSVGSCLCVCFADVCFWVCTLGFHFTLQVCNAPKMAEQQGLLPLFLPLSPFSLYLALLLLFSLSLPLSIGVSLCFLLLFFDSISLFLPALGGVSVRACWQKCFFYGIGCEPRIK